MHVEFIHLVILVGIEQRRLDLDRVAEERVMRCDERSKTGARSCSADSELHRSRHWSSRPLQPFHERLASDAIRRPEQADIDPGERMQGSLEEIPCRAMVHNTDLPLIWILSLRQSRRWFLCAQRHDGSEGER